MDPLKSERPQSGKVWTNADAAAPNLCGARMDFPWYVTLKNGGTAIKGFVVVPCILAPGHAGDHRHTFVWTNR